jgi:hypothetical protein
LSDEQRRRQWQLELARALVSEQQKRKEADEQMARVAQEAGQLQAQVEMLSRCQWPREMALWPPDRVPIGDKVAKELWLERRKAGAEGEDSVGGAGRWDFDRLVGKWKRVVKNDKSRKMGALAVPPRPTDLHETPPQTTAADGHAGQMQGVRRGGTSAAARSARTLMMTSMAEEGDMIREFKDAVMANGDGKR